MGLLILRIRSICPLLSLPLSFILSLSLAASFFLSHSISPSCSLCPLSTIPLLRRSATEIDGKLFLCRRINWEKGRRSENAATTTGGWGGKQQPLERDACGILTAPQPQSWKPVRRKKKEAAAATCYIAKHLLIHLCFCAAVKVALALALALAFAVENCSICSSQVEASEMVQQLRINDSWLRNFWGKCISPQLVQWRLWSEQHFFY